MVAGESLALLCFTSFWLCIRWRNWGTHGDQIAQGMSDYQNATYKGNHSALFKQITFPWECEGYAKKVIWRGYRILWVWAKSESQKSIPIHRMKIDIICWIQSEWTRKDNFHNFSVLESGVLAKPGKPAPRSVRTVLTLSDSQFRLTW